MIAFDHSAFDSAALSVAPGRRQPLSGKPCGILGGKENCDAGDVVRLSEASKWHARNHFLLKVAVHNAASARPFCVNDTRRNGVDACLGKNFLTLLQHWSGAVMGSASHDALFVKG